MYGLSASDEIVRAMGYKYTSARWVPEMSETIEYHNGTAKTFICSHQDWKGICSECRRSLQRRRHIPHACVPVYSAVHDATLCDICGVQILR